MVHAALPTARRRYRALFVSDLHMGARGCRAEAFLEFLQGVEAETIYLVGDILDIWHPGRLHWGAAHDAIIAELTRRQREGVRVLYLPGNHDAALRQHGRARFGCFELHDMLTHEAADGSRYLVLHGDQVDARIFRFHIMTRIGSRCDAALRALDAWLRRRLRSSAERGVFEVAISGVNALMMGNGFMKRLAVMARAEGHDGVICGHFHKAALTVAEGVTYANCGDWVDNQTALVEAEDGSLLMLEWSGAKAAQGAWAGLAEEVLQ